MHDRHSEISHTPPWRRSSEHEPPTVTSQILGHTCDSKLLLFLAPLTPHRTPTEFVLHQPVHGVTQTRHQIPPKVRHVDHLLVAHTKETRDAVAPRPSSIKTLIEAIVSKSVSMIQFNNILTRTTRHRRRTQILFPDRKIIQLGLRMPRPAVVTSAMVTVQEMTALMSKGKSLNKWSTRCCGTQSGMSSQSTVRPDHGSPVWIMQIWSLRSSKEHL